MQLAKPSGLVWNYSRFLWLEYFSNAKREEGNEFSLTAFRFLFIYAAGFSNRKQQLIFKFRPQIPQSQLFKRFTDWVQSNSANNGEPQKQQRSANVLRMG
jgi:hypothetical protein